MSEKLTRNFQTRTAGNYHSQENVEMMKAARSGNLAKTGGFAIAVDWPSVNTLLENQDTDGVRQQLDETVKQIERQSIAPRGGWHTLSVAEKESLRAQIIEGMLGGNPAPSWFAMLVNIAVRLKPDFDVPMPLRSEGFDPAKAAGGGDLRKANESYGVLSDEQLDKMRAFVEADPASFKGKDVRALQRLCGNILKSREGDDLRKTSSTAIANMRQQFNRQFEELSAQIVAVLKRGTGASTAASKNASTPRFVTRRTGDVQESDLAGATTKRAPGDAFVPQR